MKGVNEIWKIRDICFQILSCPINVLSLIPNYAVAVIRVSKYAERMSSSPIKRKANPPSSSIRMNVGFAGVVWRNAPFLMQSI
jgi:hypothetical protein